MKATACVRESSCFLSQTWTGRTRMHFLCWMGLRISVTAVQMARHKFRHPSAHLFPLLYLSFLNHTHSLSRITIHTNTSSVPGYIIISPCWSDDICLAKKLSLWGAIRYDSLKPSVTANQPHTNQGVDHDHINCLRIFLHFSPPPGSLLPNCMTDTHHLFT